MRVLGKKLRKKIWLPVVGIRSPVASDRIQFGLTNDQPRADQKSVKGQDEILNQVQDEIQEKVEDKETKRVTIIIPTKIYNQAKEIGNKFGTGYQNALKLAMVIGLNSLKDKLEE